MATTIHDIARISGVSATTVSRVLNNNYPVKKETREKVEKVIKELGYKPNQIARSLILRTTSNIGVVVPGITNLFFPTIVEEINKTIVHEGFIISLFTTDGNPENEVNVIDNIISRNMDGIILLDPSVENLENGYLEGISKHTPTIIINGMTDKYNLNFISYNEEVGTKEAFNYLLQLGHENILFARGDKSLSYDLKERVYRDFIKEKELNYSKVISVGKGNTLNVIEETENIISKWLINEHDATAIFACNDFMAIGILNACNNAKIRVPEEISIIGFDNTIISKISNPKITTVDLNMKYIGQKAAKEILYMVRNKILKVDKVLFDTKLIYRESCGKNNQVNNNENIL